MDCAGIFRERLQSSEWLLLPVPIRDFFDARNSSLELEQEALGRPRIGANSNGDFRQKIEHYEIASYGTLCTWAEQLGYTAAKTLLGQNMDDEEKADKMLSKLSKHANLAANA